MKSLCIKTNDSNILDYLSNELKNIDIEDICFSENQFKNYKNIIIHYRGSNLPYFISKISYFLALMVIDKYEEDLLKRVIIQNYFYFDVTERNKILSICFDIMSEDFSNIFDKKFEILYDNFYKFISSHKSIVLNGFINFRVKSYFNILDEIVSEAVSTFIVEKEYLEFISLLKLYVNSHSTTCEIIHVVYSDSDSVLLDENKNMIVSSNDIFNSKYLSDITFSSNDYTLNTLLTLLPKKIYIHLSNNYIDEFINTLQLIFENRVDLCINSDILRTFQFDNKSLEQNK